MHKYHRVQIGCLLSACSALLWHYFFPGHTLYAANLVEVILRLLQLVLIPNVYFSLCCAIILLDHKLLKKLIKGFLSLVASLWLLVSCVLFMFWWFLFDASKAQLVIQEFGHLEFGPIALLPFVMLLAVCTGVLLSNVPALRRYQPMVHIWQIRISRLFEMIYLLIPALVFFVVLNFLQYAETEHMRWALSYVGLSLVFVVSFIGVILPLCYRYFLGVSYRHYFTLVGTVALMTFVAGDSLAAIPLIAKEADGFGGRSDMRLSMILTMVVICFPWLGELANLIFPIYSAAVEAYPLQVTLQMLAVGPFFMFTDPLISVPALLQTFSFPEIYQSAYLTMAIFTDHMFEASEAIAVLLVCAKLKLILAQDSDAPTH